MGSESKLLLCARQPNKLQQSTQTVGAQRESEDKTREEERQAEPSHQKGLCVLLSFITIHIKLYGRKRQSRKIWSEVLLTNSVLILVALFQKFWYRRFLPLH